jgi:hypothetical protein
VKNIDKAIAIMKRAGKVDMGAWQSGNEAKTEADAHECGTVACFAGWVALSPEFQADGGGVGWYGEPILGEHSCELAIGKWLDIEINIAFGLCCGGQYCVYDNEDPTKEDVIEALETLRDTGKLEVIRRRV